MSTKDIGELTEETFAKQLQLLSERSQQDITVQELCELTKAMASLAASITTTTLL